MSGVSTRTTHPHYSNAFPMPDALDDVLQISFDALPLDDEAEPEDEFSPNERFQVVDVEGEERISGLFEYSVVFEEPIAESEGEVRAAPALPIDELTGTDVTLSFHRDDSTVRYVNGVVARLVHDHTSSPASPAADRQRYRVEIRPELWLLTLTNDYRSFSGKTVPDIVATILDDYQIPYDEDSLDENLKDRYRPRKHVVQSGESTFEFIDGLLEEAGIFYFFRQQAGFHTIVFGDDNMAFPDSPLEGENAPVLRMGTSDQNDEETLWTGALEENVVPDGHRIGDTYFDGSTTVQQREGGDGAVDRKGRPLDVVDYPGGADRSTDDTPRDHGPEILRRRLQQHQASRRLLRGVGPVRGLGTGQSFELSGHDHGPINGTEFVTRRLFVEASSADGYRVEYEAFPASTRFRGYRYADLEGPRELGKGGNSPGSENSGRTPSRQLQNQPQFDGSALALHLAEVVDASGSKKEKGNVKVDFDWSTEGSSDEVWARLAQFSADPSAGQSWGSQFVPRPGTKVLVAHEQGVDDTSNMDPFVLGCLYQGTNKLPYPNDGETEILSSIRTHSGRGDDRDAVHNEIRFVDEKDEEELGTFAPHKRLEATGFEEDIQEDSESMEVTVYDFKGEESTFRDPFDFSPEPPKRIGEDKYDELPEGESEMEYQLKPNIETYTDLPGEKNVRGSDTSKEFPRTITHSRKAGNSVIYKNLPDRSTFELGKEFREMRESDKRYFRKGIEVTEKFQGVGEYLENYDIGDPVLKIKDEGEIRNLIRSGVIESVDEGMLRVDIRMAFEAQWESENLLVEGKTTSFELEGFPLLLEGFQNMLDKARELSGGDGKVTNVQLGLDAYEKPFPTRACYDISIVGKDAYRGPGAHQGVYEENTIRPFATEGANANRIEYTAGDPEKDGVFEACNGSYRIHAHGPRLEIYRAGAEVDTDGDDTPRDFFEQEFSENWGPDGPEELDRFEDEGDTPIVILNKDGAISIRSKDGINIESDGDINIQSGSNVNIRAKENIKTYAVNEYTAYGRDMLIGKKRGLDDVSTSLVLRSVYNKIESEISEIIGKIVSIQRDVNEDKKLISNTQELIANTQRILTNTQHLISNSTTGVALSQTAISNSNTLIDTVGIVLAMGGKVFALEDELINLKQKILEKKSKAVSTEDKLVKELKGVLSQNNFGLKNV